MVQPTPPPFVFGRPGPEDPLAAAREEAQRVLDAYAPLAALLSTYLSRFHFPPPGGEPLRDQIKAAVQQLNEALRAYQQWLQQHQPTRGRFPFGGRPRIPPGEMPFRPA